jgi:hypothetical protein
MDDGVKIKRITGKGMDFAWDIGWKSFSAQWNWLTEANGGEVQWLWDWEDFQAWRAQPVENWKYLPITVAPDLVKPENKISIGRLTNLIVLGSVLPIDVRIDTITPTGLLCERVHVWEFDCKVFALAAWTEPELDKRLSQEYPVPGLTANGNSQSVRSYLGDRHIITSNLIDPMEYDVPRYVINYTSAERDNDPNLRGKVPIERPDWARVETPPQTRVPPLAAE